MSPKESKAPHLHTVQNASGAMPSALPPRLTNIQDKSRLRLQDYLARLFDSIDDVLFDMADRATSNAEQNSYFEAMRELRIQRRGIDMGFGQGVTEAFQRLAVPTGAGDGIGDDGDNAALALVDDNELEELVAIESMVSRAVSRFTDELSLLSLRFDSLVSVTTVTNANNPMGPQRVCDAFCGACRGLEVDIKVRLLLYKLFEKHVVNELGALYQSLNRQLAEEGVLPNVTLSEKVEKPQRRPTVGSVGGDAAPEEGAANDDVFVSLQELLRASARFAARTPSNDGESVRILRRATVLDTLSTLQHRPQQLATDAAGYVKEMPPRADLRERIIEAISRDGDDDRVQLGSVDEDAINLVSLLFDYLIDDDNLGVPLKAMMSLLQVPMVKVALLDKSFFSRGGHPARKLMNEMAQAGLGWQPTQNAGRDFMYRKVQGLVEKILEEFEDDVGVFQEALADFSAFREAERRRSRIVERRTLDAERGRARAEAARMAVSEAISEKIGERTPVPVVLDLLQNAWSNVLFLIYLREGTSGDGWAGAMRVVEELIWSVEPKRTEAERKRLLKLVPSLLRSLRNGLGKIGFSHFEMKKLFDELETVHLRLLDSSPGDATQPVAGEQAQPSADADAAPKTAATLDSMLSDSGFRVDTSLGDAISRMSGMAGVEDANGVTAEEQPVDESMLAQVDRLSMGSWVEFMQDEKSHYRCKLAAVVKPTGKYIFVNRAGKKVAELSRRELAGRIATDVVKLLDDRLLFDRALESVISVLRTG